MREGHREIERRGARLILVVCQSEASVRAFGARHPFPFPIAIDADREAAKTWGVWRALGLDGINVARPATFIVDGAGIVRERFVAPVQWRRLPIDTIVRILEAI